MGTKKKDSSDEKGAGWWKPVFLAAIFSAVGWTANTVYTRFIVKPAEEKAQSQAALAAGVTKLKGELSLPLFEALDFLRRVNVKGDPPDAVGHLVVQMLRNFVTVTDNDEATNKLDILPSALHNEVLQLAKLLSSSDLIMSNRETAYYSTPDSVASLNKFEPDVRRVWADLARQGH